jgi:hypothetical protein
VRLTIVQLSTFVADWRRLKLDDEDLRALEGLLLENPEGGAVMSGTGGLRKLRFAPPSRHTGKSGAMRVGYVYFPTAEAAYLVVIFAKNERANVLPAERQTIRSLLERLRKSLSGK